MQLEIWDVIGFLVLHPEVLSYLAAAFSFITGFVIVLAVDLYEAYWLRRRIRFPTRNDLVRRELRMPNIAHICHDHGYKSFGLQTIAVARWPGLNTCGDFRAESARSEKRR